MKDILDREVKIGYKVAYSPYDYNFLKIGTIVEINPKTCFVDNHDDVLYSDEIICLEGLI